MKGKGASAYGNSNVKTSFLLWVNGRRRITRVQMPSVEEVPICKCTPSPSNVLHQCLARNHRCQPNRTVSSMWTPWREEIIPYVFFSWGTAKLVGRCAHRYAEAYVIPPRTRAHYGKELQHYLDVFPRLWIVQGGPIVCPPRSPELSYLDFYFWGRLKSIIYATPSPDVWPLLINGSICLVYFTAFINPYFTAVHREFSLKVAFLSNYCNYFSWNLVFITFMSFFCFA